MTQNTVTINYPEYDIEYGITACYISYIEENTARLTAFSDAEIVRMMEQALEKSNTAFITMICDFYQLPNSLDIKERIAYYKLFKKGNNDE